MVSIVVPAFNGGRNRYLAGCLGSPALTNRPLESIVTDDGLLDVSATLVQGYALERPVAHGHQGLRMPYRIVVARVAALSPNVIVG